jgi:hypothetical protein
MKYGYTSWKNGKICESYKRSAVVRGAVTIWQMSDILAVACSLVEMNYIPLEVGT